MKFEIRLDEKLGNLNKLPAGYKKLVQYTLKQRTVYALGASENSEIEQLEGVKGDKLTQALNKAVSNVGNPISFFVIADDNGYKLYIPKWSDSESVKKTTEFILAVQEMPGSWKMDVGPLQPEFNIKGMGRGVTRLRDIVDFDSSKVYSLFIVFKDPTLADKKNDRYRARENNDPLAMSTLGWNKDKTNLMQALKDRLPEYKASKRDVKSINDYSVAEMLELIKQRSTINTSEHGIVSLSYMGSSIKLHRRVDGVIIASASTNDNQYGDLVLTKNGFIVV